MFWNQFKLLISRIVFLIEVAFFLVAIAHIAIGYFIKTEYYCQQWITWTSWPVFKDGPSDYGTFVSLVSVALSSVKKILTKINKWLYCSGTLNRNLKIQGKWQSCSCKAQESLILLHELTFHRCIQWQKAASGNDLFLLASMKANWIVKASQCLGLSVQSATQPSPSYTEV